MSNLKFDKVDELLNIDNNNNIDSLVYCDTDSLFLQLPIDVENSNKVYDYINNIQNEINGPCIDNFLKLHNIKIREKEENPLLKVDFKNEYLIKVMILYAKKKYISITVNRKADGEIYYVEDLKGVEGKKVTNKFVKNIVDDLLIYLKNLKEDEKIYDRFDILYNIVKVYIENMLKINSSNIYEVLDYFALPVNINKKISDLKNVSGAYKGCIIFDIITNKKQWKGKTGKGKWLCVKLKDESKIPAIIQEFDNYPVIKQEKKKIDDLIKDITIPDEFLQKENDLILNIFNTFELNYTYYIELLLKKIKLMYKPFDEIFCDNLLKKINNDLPQNYLIFGENDYYKYISQ